MARVATGFGSAPFHKIDGPYTVTIKDSFVGFVTATFTDDNSNDVEVTLSEVPWVVTGTVAPVAAEKNHQGIVSVAGTLTLGSEESLALDENGMYVAFLCRFPDATDQGITLGLTDGADNVGFEFDAGTISAVADDEEVEFDNVTVGEDEWVLLEMAATDTSVTARVTTADNEQTVQLNKSLAGAVEVVVDATSNEVEIDTFVLRHVLPNDISEYLGA